MHPAGPGCLSGGQVALHVAGLGSAPKRALTEPGLGLEPACAPPGSRPSVFWSSDRVTVTPVLPGQDPGRGPSRAPGDLSCSFILGSRAFAGLTHLLFRFQKFLSKVEETFQCICCQELVFRPITTVCQHNVCKVRGWPRARGGSNPRRHPVLVGFTCTSCPLPFRGPQGLFPGLPGLQLLSPPPPAFITGAHCPATTLSLQPHWPSAVPSTGRCVPTFPGGHTLVFSSILLPGWERWERMGCCPALPSGHTK